jgi:NAD(P)H-dependent FMN reductase
MVQDAASRTLRSTVNTHTPRIQVILGSTRQGRAGEQVARWFADLAAQRDDVDVELVDLRDWPLPFFDSPTSPKRELSDDPRVRAWSAKVAEADGYVLVTPEYNYGYPAVLKNALDHLYYEWNDKPVGFVGYGGMAGGIRAVQQLRQVVVELGLVQTHAQVIIPKVFAAFDETGQPVDTFHPQMASALLDEVAEWATILQAKREQNKAELASA